MRGRWPHRISRLTTLDPICPVCGQSIKMTEIVVRADDWLVHFYCREETRKRAEPGDPSDPEA